MKDWAVGTPIEAPGRRMAALIRSVRGTPESHVAAKSRLYDEQTAEVAGRVLRVDSNVIDVGANRGQILKRLIALAPEGHHVAVEPLPRHARALARRFPNVVVHHAALSDISGTARFRRVIGAPEHSSFDGIGHDPDGKAVEYFDVTVKTLDEIATDPVLAIRIPTLTNSHPVMPFGALRSSLAATSGSAALRRSCRV